jgi:hypothetical protein
LVVRLLTALLGRDLVFLVHSLLWLCESELVTIAGKDIWITQCLLRLVGRESECVNIVSCGKGTEGCWMHIVGFFVTFVNGSGGICECLNVESDVTLLSGDG